MNSPEVPPSVKREKTVAVVSCTEEMSEALTGPPPSLANG